MDRKGFTLIELLVVISIVALLSSVVLAGLNTAREKGRMATGKQFAATVEHAAGEQAVGIWEFDECSGSIAADRSGFGNNGTVTAGASWSTDTPSGRGCSLSFNGSSGAVAIPQSSSLDITDNLTVSLWTKPASFSTHGGLICYGSDNSDFETYSINTYSGPNRVDFRGNWPSTWYDTPSTALNANTWYQVVATFQSGTTKIYINGNLAGTLAWGISTLPLAADRVMRFGYNQPGGDEYYSGLLDEVRVYAKTLTGSEIEALYAAESGRRVVMNP